MEGTQKKLKENPFRKASPISKIFFWWIVPLLKEGWRKQLQLEDVFETIKEDQSHIVSNRLEREWNKELEKMKLGKQPSFVWALIRTFGFEVGIMGILVFIQEATRVIQPVLIVQLIQFFSADNGGHTEKQAWAYAGGLIALTFVQILTHHPNLYFLMKTGVRIRVASCSLIYKKILKLNHSAFTKTSPGQIVNLMSSDVLRFDGACAILHYLWIGPLQAVAVVAILWYYVGPSSLSSFVLLILFVPLQVWIGKLLSRFRSSAAKFTDQRVAVMYEILAGMRVIKMYCWEKPFAIIVAAARRKEMQPLAKLGYLHLGTNISYVCDKLCLIPLITWWYISPPLRLEIYFMIVSWYRIGLRRTFFKLMPKNVYNLTACKVSSKRIQRFLLLEENPSIGPNVALRPKAQHREISATNVSASWNEASPSLTLDSISFSVKPGEVLAVVGPVGSGKSSLLMSIMGELPLRAGHVTTRGRIAYAAQVPWVFSTTVRENVTFGMEWNQERFTRALKLSAFDKDVKSLPHADATLVGERGVTLSGGQRARLALARSLYSETDLYLLDDPLSAVDSTVGKFLFEETICKALKPYPVILVTHQLQYLERVDKILVLKEGKAIAMGTYRQLAVSGVDFTELLNEKSEEEETNANSTSDGDFSKRSPYEEGHNRSHLSQPNLGLPQLCDNENRLTKSEGFGLNHRTSLKFEAETDSDTFTPEVHPAETRTRGGVTWRSYYTYFRAGAHPAVLLLVLLSWGVAEAAYVLTDWWLARWAGHDKGLCPSEQCTSAVSDFNVTQSLDANLSMISNQNVSLGDGGGGETLWKVDRSGYFYGYISFLVAVIVLFVARTLGTYKVCVNVSKNLHDRMFAAVVRAPMRFFDTNPVGRILNRFSKDVDQMHDQIPTILFDLLSGGLQVLSILVVVCTINPWALIPVIPVLILFACLAKFFVTTSRDLKRIESIARSPVYSHVSNTLTGLYTVRAFGATQKFSEEFDAYQDVQTGAGVSLIAASRWLAIILDCICGCFISSVVVLCLLTRTSMGLDSVSVGLTLSYLISMTGIFQMSVRQSVSFESQMVSSERVQEYGRLDPEAPLSQPHFDPSADKTNTEGIHSVKPWKSHKKHQNGTKNRDMLQSANYTADVLHPNETIVREDESWADGNGMLQQELGENDRLLSYGEGCSLDAWPCNGEIVFKNVSLRYAPELPLVLNDLNLTIKSTEKIGIVGRTGAGKSSLLTVLFRLAEPEPTSMITIDGVDICKLGLHTLRSKVSIIPQDPFLFAGTLRKNLDPFGELLDIELIDALRDVELLEAFEELSRQESENLTIVGQPRTAEANRSTWSTEGNQKSDGGSGKQSSHQQGEHLDQRRGLAHSNSAQKGEKLFPSEMELALKKLEAGEFSNVLETAIQEGGANLSVGQRQLVCLARAILRKNKVLVIDEATANVDPRTDALVQKTIRTKFRHCSVLTIAHRLHTVMDSDRILVMDGGKAVEYDTPSSLLGNNNSALYQLAISNGKTQFSELKDIAGV